MSCVHGHPVEQLKTVPPALKCAQNEANNVLTHFVDISYEFCPAKFLYIDTNNTNQTVHINLY